MKTYTYMLRLCAGLFVGLAAVLWVAHATDGPANSVTTSKVIATDHGLINAVTAIDTTTLMATTATDTFKFEVAGTSINKANTGATSTAIKEGGAAICAVKCTNHYASIYLTDVIISNISTTAAANTITGATSTMCTLTNNGPNIAVAGTNSNSPMFRYYYGFSAAPIATGANDLFAAGFKEVPGPEIVVNATNTA
ncbi:MAG: hypothetical protein NT077_04225 [Candidatus Taylorbacteria bacterium]|nr:hypothetical protein [Candidatus Taylorbacteria bacterium]